MKFLPSRSSVCWLILSIGLCLCLILVIRSPHGEPNTPQQVREDVATSQVAVVQGVTPLAKLVPAARPKAFQDDAHAAWKVETTQSQLVAFAEWTERFVAADVAGQALLEAE